MSGEGVQQATIENDWRYGCLFHLKVVVKHPQQEFIQIDTSNILFICGGHSLVWENQTTASRKGGIGFTADVKKKDEGKKLSDLFRQVEATDLVKFGWFQSLLVVYL